MAASRRQTDLYCSASIGVGSTARRRPPPAHRHTTRPVGTKQTPPASPRRFVITFTITGELLTVRVQIYITHRLISFRHTFIHKQTHIQSYTHTVIHMQTYNFLYFFYILYLVLISFLFFFFALTSLSLYALQIIAIVPSVKRFIFLRTHSHINTPIHTHIHSNKYKSAHANMHFSVFLFILCVLMLTTRC